MSPSGVTSDLPLRRPDAALGREAEDARRRERLDRDPARLAAEPGDGTRRLDEPRPQIRVRSVEVGDLRARGPPRVEPSPNAVAPELVQQQPARRDPRQLDPLQRGQVRGGAAAEVVVDERELRREHRVRVELDLLLEHEPLEHDACRDVAIADRACERVDGARPDLARRESADHACRAAVRAGRPSSEASSAGPAAPGPLHRFWSRTQR